ncbi:HAD family hydrolase [Stenotrophomonas maltophilia]|uniref:HAD family hydrolase n=1 Tax=Stenotrophomonas TaxID=40323 RepID=UPI0013134ADB|nr:MULTISPECIES: HAD family hydrolase [Stenotrophomonas]ELC7323398.1 HAD family hydrolase [Stenotrophomonas maltophilia]MBA0275679.1 HAD family hydrolase [Stenotrophomonas maltophilia]MBA0412540.1 HAD family hydrolase [Stenotrophomonas maltophilia]MBA0497016.1 HAD family hydrolase [Stenotrophomonas maltophilia]MBA0501309.1 HAD family hydrolase [Stenotrophomonas maltophilia]
MIATGSAVHALSAIRHWVFDMDGTLTVAMHDFARIKRELAIPAHDDILTHLADLPAAEASAKHAWLLAHERELATASVPAMGAVALVRALQGAGCRLGILTRNVRSLAQVTLQAIGLGDVFAEEDIIGRDEAEPKPSPDGLQYFLRRWQVDPAQVVMVGDYRFDLECGRAAGTRTLLVNAPDNPWPDMACWHLADCAAVLEHWQR